MGWFSRKIKDPVDGTLHVVAVTQPPSHGRKVSLEMDVVVSVPGHESYADKWSHLVSIDKVPQPGSVLPIEASSSDPKRYEILWDQVPSNDDAAAAAAQRLADSMNAGAATGATYGAPAGQATDPNAAITVGTPTVLTGEAAANVLRTVLGAASAGMTGSGVAGSPNVTVQRSVSINGRPAQPGELAPIEQMTGMDLDGDGVIGPNPNPPA